MTMSMSNLKFNLISVKGNKKFSIFVLNKKYLFSVEEHESQKIAEKINKLPINVKSKIYKIIWSYHDLYKF